MVIIAQVKPDLSLGHHFYLPLQKKRERVPVEYLPVELQTEESAILISIQNRQ